MFTWDDGMDAVWARFFFYLLFKLCHLQWCGFTSIIREQSIVGKALLWKPTVQPVWVKTTSNVSKHWSTKFHLGDRTTLLNSTESEWTSARGGGVKLWLELLHKQPPDCPPVPGWLLYTPNSYNSQTSRGDSYVNFVTRCCRVVQCEWLAKENTSKYSGRSAEAVVVGSFTDIQPVLLWIFVWTERIWQKAYNQWILF